MIMWGDIILYPMDEYHDISPAEEILNEKEVISLPPEIQIIEEHQILFDEVPTPLRHSPIKSDPDILVTGPIGEYPNRTPVFIKDVDFSIDYENGLINRKASGTMPDLEDCYISYIYTTSEINTVLMGSGRKRLESNQQCWCYAEDYNKIKADYKGITIRTLVLHGESLDAIIYKMPSVRERIGTNIVELTLIFKEV